MFQQTHFNILQLWAEECVIIILKHYAVMNIICNVCVIICTFARTIIMWWILCWNHHSILHNLLYINAPQSHNHQLFLVYTEHNVRLRSFLSQLLSLAMLVYRLMSLWNCESQFLHLLLTSFLTVYRPHCASHVPAYICMPSYVCMSVCTCVAQL